MRCECDIEYATLSVGDIRYRRADNLGCHSLLTHESESMLRTYLVCREKQEREKETRKPHVGDAHIVLITAILLPQRLSCY
jgi:hypothetical protein